MQTLFEAANHIAQEIERTRLHLINLEQALEGLKPLITVDAATTTLTFTMTSEAQPVEDLSVVNVAVSPKRKSKARAAQEAQADKARAVKPKVSKTAQAKPAKAAPVVPEVEAAPAKLPATGAELWLKCLGRKKVTVAQLADAALKKLKLDDSARPVITTRAKAWVYLAAKKGALVDAGLRDGSKLYQLAPAKDDSQAPVAQDAEAVEAVAAVDTAPADEASEAS